MKKMLKISQRERVYLIAGGLVLLIGVVLFPAGKAASSFRQQQLELLQDEIALLEDLNGLLVDADTIQQENELLREALKGASDLLFPPIENPIMTQTMMIRLLNEMGPDLDLDISAGRSSIGDAATQMNLSVKGSGRYPELLNFLYRLETYRPVILVSDISLVSPRAKRKKAAPKNKKSTVEKTKDPGLFLKMTIQINCRDNEEGGA